MSAAIDDLKASVAELTTVTQSVVTFIEGLADQLEAHRDDPAEISRLSGEVRTRAREISGAITSNTPSSNEGGTAPPPPPAP